MCPGRAHSGRGWTFSAPARTIGAMLDKTKAVATHATMARYKAGLYNATLRELRRGLEAAGKSHNIAAKLPKEKA